MNTIDYLINTILMNMLRGEGVNVILYMWK